MERLLALLGALWATKWLTVIVAFGWQGLVLLRWFERSELLREKLGEAANYLLKAWQSVLFCFVGVSVAYMFFATPSSWKRTTASMFLIFAVMITELILSGNRMYIALLFVASATALILTNRRKALLVLTCLLPFAAFVSLFWAAWRQDAGSVHAAVAVALQSFSHGHWISTTVMELTEGFSVALLLHLIADIGNKFPLLFGSSILRIFLAPIPRTFMPDKPDTFSIVLANYYAPHSAGLSLGATAVGEAFANLGLFGIALIGTYTVILMWLSNKLLIYASPPRIITSAIGFGLAFWLARQNFFDIVLLSIYATVILVFLKPDRKELTQKISPSSDAR